MRPAFAARRVARDGGLTRMNEGSRRVNWPAAGTTRTRQHSADYRDLNSPVLAHNRLPQRRDKMLILVRAENKNRGRSQPRGSAAPIIPSVPKPSRGRGRHYIQTNVTFAWRKSHLYPK